MRKLFLMAAVSLMILMLALSGCQYIAGEAVRRLSTCSDECPSSGKTRCEGNNLIQTCGNYDSDYCLEWNAGRQCDLGCDSNTGACKTPYCKNECIKKGITQCAGSYVLTCGDYNGDTCLELKQAERPCANGCLNGACKSGSCTPSWSCTAWSACTVTGIQTRTCTDSRSCGTTTGRPTLSQGCASTCTPSRSCTAKCGGTWSDGCGGTYTCSSACGQGSCPACSCTPNCAGKVCGSNGCGGSCGSCSAGYTCSSSGTCVSACTPSRSCTAKCGGTWSDGCGGTYTCSSACGQGSCPACTTCVPSPTKACPV